jgi:hypothetical protein
MQATRVTIQTALFDTGECLDLAQSQVRATIQTALFDTGELRASGWCKAAACSACNKVPGSTTVG